MHRIALALAAGALPAAALAGPVPQPAAHNSSTFAKSEAILGGSSQLAAILARQQGLPAPANNFRVQSALTISAALAVPGATSGRPDVFGTVALAVSRTSLDHRWRSVSRSRVGGAASAFVASLKGRGQVERIEAVNWYVNRRIRFVDDSLQYGRADVWAAASETFRRGRGDCEDYAIAKLQMLRAAGFADRDLYLVIVKDLVRRADHAVLVVRAAGRMVVLDNGTDIIADAESIRDYRPIFTFAANGAWTHGYRRTVAPVTIAVAPTEPMFPAASPADQRSVSASLLAFKTGFSK